MLSKCRKYDCMKIQLQSSLFCMETVTAFQSFNSIKTNKQKKASCIFQFCCTLNTVQEACNILYQNKAIVMHKCADHLIFKCTMLTLNFATLEVDG